MRIALATAALAALAFSCATLLQPSPSTMAEGPAVAAEADGPHSYVSEVAPPAIDAPPSADVAPLPEGPSVPADHWPAIAGLALALLGAALIRASRAAPASVSP